MHCVIKKNFVEQLMVSPLHKVVNRRNHKFYMKKLFTLSVATLLGFGVAFSQTLFSTNFATEEEFNQWTVIDSNADNSTWKFDPNASTSTTFYSYHSTNAADDWLISPTIVAQKDGNVVVQYMVNGSSYGEKLEIFYGAGTTVEAMTNRASEVLELKDEKTGGYFIINATKGQEINLGFHAISDADKWRLYMVSVNVSHIDNPADLAVDSILSPVTGKDLASETVTIKVSNNGASDVAQYEVGFAIDGDTIAVEKVEQTLAKGQSVDYTFAAKADLSTPRKGFNITAWVNTPDDISLLNNQLTTMVTHQAPASVPYYMGFEANEYTADITFFNLNNDDGDWSIHTDPWWNTARTGFYSLAYNYNRDNNADDWAILDAIQVTEPGFYVLKFWYSTDDSHPENFSVYYGDGADPSAMTNLIVEYKNVASSAYQESISIIKIEEPQILNFGFYAFSVKDQNWICIDDVSFEKISSEGVDLEMGKITNPTQYVHKLTPTNVIFPIRNIGINDAAATIKILVDDQVVSEINDVILAQETREIIVPNVLSSLSEGLHNLEAVISSDDDANKMNDTARVEFRIMGEAALFWDFENGMPEDFTFRVEDEGTINPGAGAEFNEYGWGIFNIVEHAQFGEHVLAGCSWIDGASQADRWCILPRVKITSENAYLVWDVASFNEYFPEDYRVKVSSGDDTAWDYWTEASIYAESPQFKTRGVDLSSYSGKDVYIAFQLVSKNCENLILDNIGLYGQCEQLSGVEEIIDDKQSIDVSVKDGIVMVKADDIVKVSIYDIDGRELLQTTQSQVNASALNSGLYVVKVETQSGVATSKIIL